MEKAPEAVKHHLEQNPNIFNLLRQVNDDGTHWDGPDKIICDRVANDIISTAQTTTYLVDQAQPPVPRKVYQDFTTIARRHFSEAKESTFDDTGVEKERRKIEVAQVGSGEKPEPSEIDGPLDPLPCLLIIGNGGLRFDPVFFPRVETVCFAHDIPKAWNLDHIINFIMEKTGVVRYNGQSYGTPACESDGIPGQDESGWNYVYRSYLLTHVGPTARFDLGGVNPGSQVPMEMPQ